MFNLEKLESILIDKGWTRYRLSKESGISQTTLRDIFGVKKVTPTTKTLSKLAEALDVPIGCFFDDENIENSSTNVNKKPDNDMRRIERARSKMKPEDKEKMMKILELSFEEYFDDED